MTVAHDSTLDAVRIAIVVLAAAVIVVALVDLVHRAVTTAWQRFAARRAAALAPLVYRAIDDPTAADALVVGPIDSRVMRTLLLRLAMDLRGENAEAVARLYERFGLAALDHRRLRSRRWARRADAAANLGTLRVRSALPGLTAALDDPSVQVRRTAVWAVGQVGGRDALVALVTRLADPSVAVAQRAEEILAERGHQVASTILSFAHHCSSRSGRLAAIELFGWLRLSAAAGLLVELMQDPDPEVRVKAVKAASAIGDPSFVAPLEERLQDERWEVRCQAARGLSALGSPHSVPQLEAALRDRHWWVRFYAATALAEVGAAGAAALSAALEDPDPSVREMAGYLLHRDAAPALV